MFYYFFNVFFLFDQVFFSTNPVYLHGFRLTRYLIYSSFSYFNYIFSLFCCLVVFLNIPCTTFLSKQFCYGSSFFIWVGKFALLVFFFFFILSLINSQSILKFEVEFFVLFIFCIFGLFTLLSSRDWLLIYLSIEIFSLSAYSLVAFKRYSIFSTEGGLKYFIIGSVSSGFLLLGISLIYGALGTVNLPELELMCTAFWDLPQESFGCLMFGIIFISCGLIMKLAGAPFHFWAVDAYDGASLIVTWFLNIIPKIGLLFLFGLIFQKTLWDFSSLWCQFFWWSSLLSFLFGTISALTQLTLKRLFLYSMVANTGFFLASFYHQTFLGILGWLLFLVLYCTIMSLIFLFLQSFRSANNLKLLRSFDNLKNLSVLYPVRAYFFLFGLFALAGVPPLAGFFGKFFILRTLFLSPWWSLAFVLIFASLLSLFYYLRLIKLMFFESRDSYVFLAPVSFWSAFIQSILVIIVFGFIFFAQPLLLFLIRISIDFASVIS